MPFSSSQKSLRSQLELKVGGVSIDALGRKWDPSKHPRDSRGRFIETGGIVRVGLGGLGKVRRSMVGGKVEVRMADGSTRIVPHQHLTMVRRPDGSKPTASVRKVVEEDAKREQHPDRGDGKYDADDNPDIEVPNADPADEDTDNPYDGDDEDPEIPSVPDAYTPSREDAREGDLVTVTARGKDGEVSHIFAKVDTVTDNEPDQITLADKRRTKTTMAKVRDVVAKNGTVEDHTVIPFEDLNDPAALMDDAEGDDGKFAVLDNETATDLVEGHAKATAAKPTRQPGSRPGGGKRTPQQPATPVTKDDIVMGRKPGTVEVDGRIVGRIERDPSDPKFWRVTDRHGRSKRVGQKWDTGRTELARLLNNPPQPKEQPKRPAAPDAPAPKADVERVTNEKASVQPRALTRTKTSRGDGVYISRSGNLAAIKSGRSYAIARRSNTAYDHEASNLAQIDGDTYEVVGSARTLDEFRTAWIDSAEDHAPTTPNVLAPAPTEQPSPAEPSLDGQEQLAAERPTATTDRDYAGPTTEGETDGPLRADGAEVLGDVPAVEGRDDQRPDGVLRRPVAAGGGADRGGAVDAPDAPAEPDAGADRGRAPRAAVRGDGDGAGRPGVPAAGGRDRGEEAAGVRAAGLGDQPAVAAAPAKTTAGPSVAKNLAALRLLRALETEGRAATAAERKILAGWSGWGALPKVFDPDDTTYAAERTELQDLLGEDGWRKARTNMLNAHYTDPALVTAIWDGVKALGFDGGEVLEPGSGSGNFIAQAPDGAHMTGVEVEPVTAGIARALHPDADIHLESFAKSPFRSGVFDAVIGNVPFGAFALRDRRHNQGNHSIHNHFIIKSLDTLKPGGVMAVVTSSFTLDNADDRARREMYDQADLIGAVRLPENAHDKAAGTSVVTDVLVFRKRKAGEAAGDATWLGTSEARDKDGQPVTGIKRGEKDPTPQRINDYYANRPQDLLGEVRSGGYNGIKVVGSGDNAAKLRARLAAIAADAKAAGLGHAADRTDGDTRAALRDSGSTREGRISFARTVKNTKGKDTAVFERIEDGRKAQFDVPATQADEFAALLELRDLYEALMVAETEAGEDDDDTMTAARGALRGAYRRYVAKYGPVSRYTVTTRDDGAVTTKFPPVMGKFRQDEGASVVYGLEHGFDADTGTAKEADVLTSRQINVSRQVAQHTDDPADAIALASERPGGLSDQTLADVLQTTPAAARKMVTGLVFNDPDQDGQMVSRAAYLSGNVRKKLAAARAAAAEDDSYAENVTALEEVVPADATLGDIPIQLGSAFIGADIVQQFAKHLMGPMNGVSVENDEGQWRVVTPTGKYGRNAQLENATWGTDDRSFYKLLEAILKGQHRIIRITRRNEDGSTWVDKKASEEAALKAQEIEQEFQDWVWANPRVGDALTAAYTERHRSLVPRTYDDAAQRAYPGMVGDLTLRPHQNAAVTRAVNEPAVLFEHVVGAGKTYTLAASAMELRRLGLARKPVLTVPNHMLAQWTAEFRELYPNAKILAADSDVLQGAENRKRFAAMAANNDWDVVLMTHTAFESIPTSREWEEQYLYNELDRYERQLRNAAKSGDKKREKQIQTNLEKLKKKIEDRLSRRKDDNGITFESMGFDYVMADEAHVYKNLDFQTGMQGISPPEGSGRARDMHMKLELLRSLKPADGTQRVAAFATGTPISNSLAEMYTMTRFMRPDLLEEAGVADFDAWAATFATVTAKVEQDTSANGWVERVRMRGFTDALGDALRIWRTFSDTKTAKDLNLPRPTLKGGARQIHVVTPSEAQLQALASFKERVDTLPPRRPEKGDDTHVAIIGDGRRAAIDPRLMSERGLGRAHVDPDDETIDSPKIAEAAARILGIYQARKDDRFKVSHDSDEDAELTGALQMVMIDSDAPKKGRRSSYQMLKDALVAGGMPADSIRFVQEAAGSSEKKAKLFEDARQGRVSVLMGSTAALGTGTNVQNRLYALHHIDGSWKPSDIEQREGRILRQGNQYGEVEVHAYVTERTHDVKTWDMTAYKQAALDAIAHGSYDLRAVEFADDVDPLTDYDTITGLASGDPLVQERRDLGPELKRLRNAERSHRRQIDRAKGVAQQAQRELDVLAARRETLVEALARRTDISGDNFSITLTPAGSFRPRRFEGRKEAGEALKALVEAKLDETYWPPGTIPGGIVGSIGGLDIRMSTVNDQGARRQVYLELTTQQAYRDALPLNGVLIGEAEAASNIGAALTRLENRVNGIENAIAKIDTTAAQARGELGAAEEATRRRFRFAEDLADAERRELLLDKLLTRNVDDQAGESMELLREEYDAVTTKQKNAESRARKDRMDALAAEANRRTTPEPEKVTPAEEAIADERLAKDVAKTRTPNAPRTPQTGDGGDGGSTPPPAPPAPTPDPEEPADPTPAIPAAPAPQADAEAGTAQADGDEQADRDAIDVAATAAQEAALEEGATADEATEAAEAAAADEATKDADRTAERPIPPAPPAEPKTPRQLDDERYPLSEQQQPIADAVVADRKSVKVEAKAGAGKTSTLVAIAKRFEAMHPETRIGYVAFNKSVQTEAESRFPGNTETRTGHSIAFRWRGKDWTDAKFKSPSALRNASDIAAHLNIPGDDAARRAQAVMRAVGQFANSADDDLGYQHFTTADGTNLLDGLSQRDRVKMLGYAKAAWKDLQALDGRLNVDNDHIRKMWALSRPDFSKPGSGMTKPVDVLFLDEAQDTPPVLAKVIEDQKMQKVIVGDGDQAIYGFTGAVDYLAGAGADESYPLTKSYRFGPQIADWGNRFLQVLGSEQRVVGGGPDSTIVPDMDAPDAILTRSNSGMFDEILREQEAGRTVGVPTGTKADLSNLITSARYLRDGGTPPKNGMHEDLAAFRTWQEFTDAVEDGDDQKLASLDRLFSRYDMGQLYDIVDNLVEEGENGLDGVTVDSTDSRMALSGNTFKLNKKIKETTGGGIGQAGFRWIKADNAWVYTGTPEQQQAALAKLKELAGGDARKPDVTVSTAHKSKGLEWARVRIGGDFRGPQEDEATGEITMPDPEELRLAYVAVTRAEKELDLGSLGWVADYSNANGETGRPTSAPLPEAAGEPSARVTASEDVDGWSTNADGDEIFRAGRFEGVLPADSNRTTVTDLDNPEIRYSSPVGEDRDEVRERLEGFVSRRAAEAAEDETDEPYVAPPEEPLPDAPDLGLSAADQQVFEEAMERLLGYRDGRAVGWLRNPDDRAYANSLSNVIRGMAQDGRPGREKVPAGRKAALKRIADAIWNRDDSSPQPRRDEEQGTSDSTRASDGRGSRDEQERDDVMVVAPNDLPALDRPEPNEASDPDEEDADEDANEQNSGGRRRRRNRGNGGGGGNGLNGAGAPSLPTPDMPSTDAADLATAGSPAGAGDGGSSASPIEETLEDGRDWRDLTLTELTALRDRYDAALAATSDDTDPETLLVMRDRRDALDSWIADAQTTEADQSTAGSLNVGDEIVLDGARFRIEDIGAPYGDDRARRIQMTPTSGFPIGRIVTWTDDHPINRVSPTANAPATAAPTDQPLVDWNDGNPSNLPPLGRVPISVGLVAELAAYLENGRAGGTDQGYTLASNHRFITVHDKDRTRAVLSAIAGAKRVQAATGNRGAGALAKAAEARVQAVNALPDAAPGSTVTDTATDIPGVPATAVADRTDPADLRVGDVIDARLFSTGENGPLTVESAQLQGTMIQVTGRGADGGRDFARIPNGQMANRIGRAAEGNEAEPAWNRNTPADATLPQAGPRTPDDLTVGDVFEATGKNLGTWRVTGAPYKSGFTWKVPAERVSETNPEKRTLNLVQNRPVNVIETSPAVAEDIAREAAEEAANPEAFITDDQADELFGGTPADAAVSPADDDAITPDAPDADDEDTRPVPLVNGHLPNPQGLTLPADLDGDYSPAQIEFLSQYAPAQVVANIGDRWEVGDFDGVRDGQYMFRPARALEEDDVLLISPADLHEVRGIREAEGLAEEVEPEDLRLGTRVGFLRAGSLRVGVLESVSGGRAHVRDTNGVLHPTVQGGKVRPVMGGYLPGAEPQQAAFAPRAGVWTADGEGWSAAAPGQWAATVTPNSQDGHRWAVEGVPGSGFGARSGAAADEQAAREAVVDALYQAAGDGAQISTLPGSDENDRDARSRELADTLAELGRLNETTAGDTPAEETDPAPVVDGARAAWVPTGSLEPGDVAQVDGDNGNGSATTRTGHVLGTPETVEVHSPTGGKPVKGTRTTVGPDRDGYGDRETLLSAEESVAARVERPDESGDADNPASAGEAQILGDAMTETLPGDANGIGVFPGSVVTDRSGRNGYVTEVTDLDVAVRWAGNDSDDRVRPGLLTVADGQQNRADGWTSGGRRVETGQMVTLADGDTGRVTAVLGDDVEVETTSGGTVTVSAGSLKVVGTIADTDTPAAWVTPAFDAPGAPEGLDVRPTEPIKPDPIDSADQVIPVLTDADREVLAELGIDTDATSPLQVQQAAARIRHGLPVTLEQASDLSAWLGGLIGSKGVPAGRIRKAKRLRNRLDAAVGRAGGIPSPEGDRPATMTAADIVKGDVIAVPNAATGEATAGTVRGVWRIQNGQIVVAAVEHADGTWTQTRLNPDGEVFLLPDLDTDPGATGIAVTDEDRPFTEPRVNGRLQEAVDAVADAATAGDDPAGLEQLAADVTGRLGGGEEARTQRNSRRRLKRSLAESGADPAAAGTAYDAAEDAADDLTDRVAETIRATVSDAEPLPGEADGDAAARVRDRLRAVAETVDYDAETDAAFARLDASDVAPSTQEQARARRDVADALRADLFAMADQLAEIGNTDDANALSDIAARLAGRPDERQVQRAAAAAAMGRPPSRIRSLLARIRGMFTRARLGFLNRVRALLEQGRRTRRTLKAAVAAARTEWNADADADALVADAARLLAAGGDPDITTPAGEPAGFTERIAYWTDQLPESSSMFGRTPATRRGFRGLTLAGLRRGDRVQADDLTGAVLDRAADGGPGETAVGHHAAVVGIGRAVRDEVDARVRAALPDYGPDPAGVVADAQAYAARVAAEERGDLTDDELADLRAKARVQADQAAREYATARATAVAQVLADLRPMGPRGAAAVNALGRTGDAPEMDAVRWAEQWFPTDWLAAAGSVEVRTGRMGSYADGDLTIAPLTEGMVDGAGRYGASAVHGLGHHFETVVPGLADAGWVHHWLATSDGPVGSRTRRGANALAWFADLFPGVGFEPGDGAARGRTSQGTESDAGHYEWVPSAFAAVFAGAEGNTDDDLQEFMLGLLAWLGRNR